MDKLHSYSSHINFSNRKRKGAKSRKTKTRARAKTIHRLPQRELRDFSRWYRCDTNIISRVIALEKRLGHPPSILDLFCAGFTPSEIHSVDWQLVWLYGANSAYETSIPVPDSATYDVGVAAA